MDDSSSKCFSCVLGKGRKAFIRGTFTDGKDLPMTDHGDGGARRVFKLPVGIHKYCFYVDGNKVLDPKNTMPLINDLNQVVIHPTLPPAIPHSLRGHAVAHLFLKFHPSTKNAISDFIKSKGFRLNLVSIIMLDHNIASACALFVPLDIKTRAIEDLNGEKVTGGYELEVLEFAQPLTEYYLPGMSTSNTLLIGPRFPETIVEQHIVEHLSIFGYDLLRVKKEDHSFIVKFSSLTVAQEVLSAFNNSLLNGIQISVNFSAGDFFTGNNSAAVASMETSGWPSPLCETTVREPSGWPSPLCETTVREPSGPTKVFVYSNPKFPNSISNGDLMKHFSRYDPLDAFIIRKSGNSTGIGVVTFKTKQVAKNVIKKMKNTKVVDLYSISLKLEDPTHPPKSQAHFKDKKNPSRDASDTFSKIQATEHREAMGEASWIPSSPKDGSSKLASCSIKVSHLPRHVTVKMLKEFFKECGTLDGSPVIQKVHEPYAWVNFVTPVAAMRASKLNHSVLEGSKITIKLANPPPTPKLSPKSVNNATTIKFTPQEWKRLCGKVTSSNNTVLDEILSPYKDSSNVSFNLISSEQVLELTGEKDHVKRAYNYIIKQTKKEISIDTLTLEAMVYLNPSLPSRFENEYNVHVVGYSPGSGKVQFHGPVNGVEKAYEAFTVQMHALQRTEVELDGSFQGQIDVLREILKKEGGYPHLLTKNMLILYHFKGSNVRNMKSMISIQTKHLYYKEEEIIFLRNKHLHEMKLMVEIEYGEKSITFKGRHSAIKNAEDEIAHILSGIHCHRVDIACNQEVISQIEAKIIVPFQRKDSTFEHFITISGQNSNRSIYIFCKNKDVYAEACKLLEQLDPITETFPLCNAKEVLQKMKDKLQDKYYTQIDYDKSTVKIHGLIKEHIHQCFSELKEAVETTTLNMKTIPLTSEQREILNHFHKDELCELRGCCSEVSVGKQNLLIKGSVREVESVAKRLESSGLLSSEVYWESFEVNFDPKFCKLWYKVWQEIEEKAKDFKTLVQYDKSFNTPVIKFKVISSDKARASETRKLIEARSEAAEVSFNISRPGSQRLNQALKDKEDIGLASEFLSVCIIEASEWSREVNICVPVDFAKDLENAKEQIRKFVGKYTRTSRTIHSKDPVVGLILHSKSLSNPYLQKACNKAKDYSVSITVLERPCIGLELKGAESSLETVAPIISRLTLRAIEESIGEKKVEIKSVCTPLLDGPEYLQIKSKLESDYCVMCYLPGEHFTNEKVDTLSLELSANDKKSSVLVVDIIKGDIVMEHVDAIVNAANERLKHSGGVAKALSDAGGPEIQSESDSYIKDHPTVAPGTAVFLSSGRLPCQYIIHAVGPRWNGGNSGEAAVLSSAVLESLKLADERNLTSIAFPAIGTGIFNVPIEFCAKACLEGVTNFCLSHPSTSICNIRFVLFNQSCADVFCSALPTLKSVQTKDSSTTLPTLPLSETSQATEEVSIPLQDPTPLPLPMLSLSNSSMETSQATEEVSIPLAQLEDPTPPAVSYEWKWRNDQGTYSPYDTDINYLLNAAYLQNPRGSCSITVHSTTYKVNFTSMKQINSVTRYKRGVIRVAPGEPKATWFYCDDRQKFTPYLPADSQIIESMYQAKKPSLLVINQKPYFFDFDKMEQVNMKTYYSRKIKRQLKPVGIVATDYMCLSDDGDDADDEEEEESQIMVDYGPPSVIDEDYGPPSVVDVDYGPPSVVDVDYGPPSVVNVAYGPPVDEDSGPSPVILTLRGPQQHLGAAEMNLVKKLDGYIKSEDIYFPGKVSRDLESVLEKIALSNNLSSSFGECETGQMVMKIEGIEIKLLKAAKAIQKEIIDFQATSSQQSAVVFPEEWESQKEDELMRVFRVSEGSKEWQHVKGKFEETMPNYSITEILRIQNKRLWEKYVHQRTWIEKKNNGDAKEMELFHGSRENDPKEIYEGEDGFDMRFSREGMWGLANYFAVNARYSHDYAHTSRYVYAHTTSRYSTYSSQSRKIFLVKVLTGDSYWCKPDHSLRMPPLKSKASQLRERYDSVSGYTGGSDVYMTYDNEKAYPAYLITYSPY